VKTIFRTIIPGWSGKGLPKDYPAYIRLVISLSVIVAHVFSIFNYGLPFGMISPEKQHILMGKMYHHKSGLIRNIVQFWKITAFMTIDDK
jgi:hypothetical protein